MVERKTRFQLTIKMKDRKTYKEQKYTIDEQKETIAGLETNVKNLKDLNSILESDIKKLKTDKNTIKNTFEMLLAYIKEFF